MSPEEVTDAVHSLVAGVNGAAGSEWDSEMLRAWLTEYLVMREEDVARFASEVDRLHWDLSGLEGVDEQAGFFLAEFTPAQVRVFGGVGRAAEVQAYGESEHPDERAEVASEAARRFQIVGEPVVVSRGHFDAWLLPVVSKN